MIVYKNNVIFWIIKLHFNIYQEYWYWFIYLLNEYSIRIINYEKHIIQIYSCYTYVLDLFLFNMYNIREDNALNPLPPRSTKPIVKPFVPNSDAL